MLIFREVNDSITARQVAELLGCQPSRAGFILSPFKEERTPSCKLYERSFYDFATAEGGDCIKLAAVMLGVDNWQACKYLIDAFNLPFSVANSREMRDELEKRKTARLRQQAAEERYKAAWRTAVDRLKTDEEIWSLALGLGVFTPFSTQHARALQKVLDIQRQLDLLCGEGSRADCEHILKKMGWVLD